MSELSASALYVSWHDTEVLTRSLERLAEVSARDSVPLKVVVVINEADADAVGRIDRSWPGATVILNAENRGFGAATNQAAAAADGDILLLLNPDTLATDNCLSEIERAFARYPGAVAVAPRLIDAGTDGDEAQRLFQLRRLPSLWTDARELLLLDQLLPGNGGQQRTRYLDADRERPFEVEQAAAAAFAVRRQVFEAIGGFDERFWPAYWEDVDLCLRLGQQGSILFWPYARVEHVGGVSAEALGRRRFLLTYYRNALRYRVKHYRPRRVLAYRVLLALGMLLRGLATAHRALRRGHRDTARGFAEVALMALRGAPDEADR